MNGAVLLARRLGQHLHAGVEDLVARHHQLGSAAAKQGWEHAPEVLVDLVEGLRQQVAGFEVNLVDGTFERGDGFGQVGVLRVEKGLALARGGQLFERGHVDGAERGNVKVDTVDVALQALQLHPGVADRLRQRRHVHRRGRELLKVLRAAKRCGLLFELQLGDLLAQRLQAAFGRQALLVEAAQLGTQVVVLAALCTQRGFALELERQRGLQTGLGHGVIQRGQLGLQLLGGLAIGRHLLGRRGNGALQFGAPRAEGARLELRLLRLAFERAALLARGGQRALGGDHGFIQFGVALLGHAELLVEFLKARLARGAALCERFELSVQLGQFFVELAAACRGGLGLLGQAHQLDLHLVRAGLGLGRLAAHAAQLDRSLGVSRLGPHQGAAGVVGHQRLRTLLALKVLDLLRPRQQAGLLAVGGVEADRELRHRVAVAGHDDFAMRQLAALGQGFVERAGGVDAFEPVQQQGL